MKFKVIMFLVLGFVPALVFAQREKGKILKAPKILSNKQKTSKPPSKIEEKNFNSSVEKDMDFEFMAEPKITETPNNTNTKAIEVKDKEGVVTAVEKVQIEPVKVIIPEVQDDTSTIDEGENLLVEIEEMGQFEGNDELMKIASYYSIWDTKSLNPYGINPKEFDSIIPLKLYDEAEGRFYSSPLDVCKLTSHFGWRWKRWHKGTDLDLETGDPVYAAFDGIVRISGVLGGFGRVMVLRHYNGLETVYGHLSKQNFEENTIVRAGDEIGKGGNTGRSSGSHLHFETRYEGNAFDPEKIFKFAGGKATIESPEFLMTSKAFDYLRGGVSKENTDFAEEEEEKPKNVTNIVWYVVKSGDTMSKIASKFNTTMAEIARLNKMSSYKKVYKGVRIRVK
jgi:murein DD-endopeptidase MepM/ murein hydrolase activator NlpD